MNTLTDEQKTMIDRIIGDGLDDYSATRRSYSEVRTTMFNGVLDIINPPQKVEPVELNCFIYQQANGQIYFTVNRVRNDTEMDHFTVRWSGKNTAEIVKGE